MNAVDQLNILNTNNSCLHFNFPTVGTCSYISKLALGIMYA